METFSQRTVKRFQEYRSKKFSSLGDFFLKYGISANVMSFFSIFLGCGAAYFLFQNYLLFVLFGILHILADALDGILARKGQTTLLGKYLDHILADGLVVVFILIKIGWYLQDYYGYVTAGMYLLSLLVYAASRLEAPMLFTRTITVVGAMLYLPFFPITALLVLNYLISGVAAAWCLALQLQWYLQRR